MTAFQPGDVVDIEIRDAKVTDVQWHAGVQQITVQYFQDDDSNTEVSVYPELDAVTVTRRQPQPQAGDVWEGVWSIPGGMLFSRATWISDEVGELMGVGDCLTVRPLGELDFTNARKVWPLDAAVPVAAPTLRRFRHRDGHIFTETEPGSDLYTYPGSTHATMREDCYGHTTDLPPVPADAEAV